MKNKLKSVKLENTFSIAIIYWKDACMFGGGTQRYQDCQAYDLMQLISVGIIIKHTKDSITIGSDYSKEQDTFRHVNIYPMSGIKKIEVVNRKDWEGICQKKK